MNKLKYVMFKDNTYVILSLGMDHSIARRISDNIHSAGFVSFTEETNEYSERIITANCYGKSVSLSTIDHEMKADPEHDEMIINIDLRMGL